MTNVRQAVVYSSASRYIMKIMGLVSAMVIARLLTPGEIGIFAIASAIVMVMSEFRLLGAGSYLVRERDIPVDKIRSALGLTIIISWGLGLVIYLVAPSVARFYELTEVTNVFRILSVSFFLAPFVSIPTALLTREFKFKILFIIKLIATVVGLLSTVGLILLDYSYYALAWGHTLSILVEFIIIILFWPPNTPWQPSFRNLGGIISFGIFSSLTNLFKKAIVTAPDMVIGKVGTTVEVGIYSRGLGFIEFLSQSLMMGINPVALPYLSETKRSGNDMGWAYTRASVLLSGMVWPVLAVASLASAPTIRLFFGDQWDAAAPLASLLAFWGMLRSIHWLSNALMTASGKEKIMVIKEGAMFGLFFSGVILAYPYGLEWVAVAFIGIGFLEVIITTCVLARCIGLDWKRFAKAWIPNVLVTAVCWIVTYLISMSVDFNGANYWIPVLVIACVLPPVWILSLKISRHLLYQEIARLLRRKVSSSV